MNAYFKEYAKEAARHLKLKRKLTAVIDASNGYSGVLMKEVFRDRKDVRVFYINALPDGDFPGHGPNPLAAGAMDELKKKVISKGADIGFIFDGDGDRVMFVDDKGRDIDPDVIIKLCLDILSPKKAVIDARVGWLVRKDPNRRKKTKIIRVKVGNYFVKKAMIKEDAEFGAERSSHFFLRKGASYIDVAPEIACLVMTAVAGMKHSVSEWIDSLPPCFRSGEKNFSVTDKEAAIKRVEDYYAKMLKVSRKDGAGGENKEYWFNVRPSANEDLIRVNIEAKTEDILKRELKAIKSLIQGR